MTEIQTVAATWFDWDPARDLDENNHPVPDQVSELIEAVGTSLASGGQSIVLPGRTPETAVILVVNGTGDGQAVTGSISWTDD